MTKHTQQSPRADNPFTQVRDLFTSYITFPDPVQADICALWVVGTHIFRNFDTFGYLHITASTKRAGKSVLAALMSFTSRDGKMGTSMTASVLRRLVARGSTLFFDEAESLNSEASSSVREYLNIGYRAGQCVYMPGDGPDEVIEYPAYSPKCFILIGDVNDTLRDRSITIELRRAPAQKIYKQSEVERLAKALQGDVDSEGITALTRTIEKMTADASFTYDEAYDFLDSRTAETWQPIFSLAKVFCPERIDDLTQFAAKADMKKQTAESQRFSEIRKQAETTAADDTMGERAMRDLMAVFQSTEKNKGFDGERMFTEEALRRMNAILTSGWEAYKGTGLTAVILSDLVSTFGVNTKYVKIKGITKRGFQRADVVHGFKKIGTTE